MSLVQNIKNLNTWLICNLLEKYKVFETYGRVKWFTQMLIKVLTNTQLANAYGPAFVVSRRSEPSILGEIRCSSWMKSCGCMWGRTQFCSLKLARTKTGFFFNIFKKDIKTSGLTSGSKWVNMKILKNSHFKKFDRHYDGDKIRHLEKLDRQWWLELTT